MPPIPLEGAQMPSAGPQEGSRSISGSISLGMLIDLIVQRTYHELTVLAELLPRKTDMERKIEIYNYSARTRQLFVRLLALVKWANSASKVDKSAQIMAFLEKQSLLFVDTADMLARMARDTLVHARLPSFHIPAAVEVLTTGTFGRLPSCIRDRIVPPDPITPGERRSTLERLNHVIQQRLVSTNLVPQMRNLKIDAGRVTFTVENEFEVSLTVMGDGANIPWRLLDIDILVDDKETGDGKALVHSLQVHYIHQLVQARLVDNPQPLAEVYHTLHAFCQSLQLEVLYSQTLRLCRDRLDDLIHVDDYTPGKCLTVSYWKELAAKDPRSELGYKLTIQVDPVDLARPLSLIHLPQLPLKESDIADRAIRSEFLSMERLLVHTIYMRTKRRLAELQTELETTIPSMKCELKGTPAVLAIPVVQPCLKAELLLIAVDTFTGMMMCSVPQYEPPIIVEIALALNGDRSRVATLLTELRFWLVQRRCEKTLQQLPATAYERLPLLHLPDHPMTKISRHRMYIRLHRHPNSILIVELKERSNELDVDFFFYMAYVKQSSIEDDPDDDSIETEIPKMYLKVLSLIEFDTFVLLHGPFTSIEDDKMENLKVGVKRKLPSASSTEGAKKALHPAYFVPELAHVVALCDERLPFVHLAQELNRRGIPHQGIQVETGAIGLVLKIVELPSLTNRISPAAMQTLMRRVLSVSIRVHGKGTGRSWMCELVFYGSPLTSLAPKEQGLRRPVYLTYDMAHSEQPARTVDSLLADWAQIVQLYDLVHRFADDLQAMSRLNIQPYTVIRSFTYSRLVIGYGPDKLATCTIAWSEERKAFNLLFGAQQRSYNAHALIREQLEAHLNRHRSLSQLSELLAESYRVMCAISKLPVTPQLGVHNNRPQVPVQSFTVIPQTHNLLKLVYQGMYCLELRLKNNGLMSIRDGAYSRFDRSYVIDELTPTQGLKGFLGKYVEETVATGALRRRSQCEDDDPPSPMAVDDSVGGGSMGGGGFHSPAGGSTAGGLKFCAPVTPPSGSNPHTPHTPSSPHPTSSSSQPPYHSASPATSFSLASPPGLATSSSSAVNPSPAGMLSHASPGGSSLLGGSPGGGGLHVQSPAGGGGALASGVVSPGSGVQQIGHSPGSFLSNQGTTNTPTPHPLDASPFSISATSPAVSGWPGSPSLPRPSPRHSSQQSPAMQHTVSATAAQSATPRILPPKSWAGAVPTVLTHEAFEVLCTSQAGGEMCPLAKFLGCVFMRRQLQRIIQGDECLTPLTSTEPLVVLFKVETLQCRVILEPQFMQSLQLKVSPLPEHKDQWSHEEMTLLEKFFDTRAATLPYKPNALVAFCRMLNVPFNVLKDFLQIIKLEMMPGLIQQNQFKWTVQWCLRVPPSASPLVPIGQPAVIICRNKILFYVQITRVGGQYAEPPTLVLPLVYDISTNITQMAEKRDPGPASALTAVSLQLKRFAEFGLAHSTGECSLFPALRDLLANLILPSEPPQMISSPAHTGSNTPTMQPSPAMMHSPMSAAMNPQVQGGVMGPGGPPVQSSGPGPYPGMGMGQHMMGPN